MVVVVGGFAGRPPTRRGADALDRPRSTSGPGSRFDPRREARRGARRHLRRVARARRREEGRRNARGTLGGGAWSTGRPSRPERARRARRWAGASPARWARRRRTAENGGGRHRWTRGFRTSRRHLAGFARVGARREARLDVSGRLVFRDGTGAHRTLRETTERVRQATLPGDTPIAVDCRRFIVARGGGARGARRVARMGPLMRTGPSVRSEFSAEAVQNRRSRNLARSRRRRTFPVVPPAFDARAGATRVSNGAREAYATPRSASPR